MKFRFVNDGVLQEKIDWRPTKILKFGDFQPKLVALVKIFFDIFGKISSNLIFLVIEKWKNGLPDAIWLRIVNFFRNTLIMSTNRSELKKRLFSTKYHHECNFFTFYFPKSFKYAEIFSKMSKKILTSVLNQGKKSPNIKISVGRQSIFS